MKQRKILYIAILAVILVGITVGTFVFAAYNPQSPTKFKPTEEIVLKENPELVMHDTKENLSDSEKQAILAIQNFKGNDKEGRTLAEVLAEIITKKYSNDVLKDSKTEIGWSAFSNPEKPDLVGVAFTFNSTADTFSFLWSVDTKSGSITPASDGAKQLMNIVEKKDV